MQRPNNLMEAIQQARKMVGNGDPNVFVQNFIEQNHIPQNVVNQAQSQVKDLMQLLGIKG